jgi:methyl acetate hydrolase
MFKLVWNSRYELTPEMRDNLASAHFKWPDGSVTVRGKIFSDDVSCHVGGAGAYCTADDYAQVLLILLNEGKHRESRFQGTKKEGY